MQSLQHFDLKINDDWNLKFFNGIELIFIKGCSNIEIPI